jgi:hypothetical protein
MYFLGANYPANETWEEFVLDTLEEAGELKRKADTGSSGGTQPSTAGH